MLLIVLFADEGFEGKDMIEINAKSIILHTLGNTNHELSKPLLLRYLKDPKYHTRLRRSAAKALRHYTCHEVRINSYP